MIPCDRGDSAGVRSQEPLSCTLRDVAGNVAKRIAPVLNMNPLIMNNVYWLEYRKLDDCQLVRGATRGYSC
jgi:hypothetical protein